MRVLEVSDDVPAVLEVTLIRLSVFLLALVVLTSARVAVSFHLVLVESRGADRVPESINVFLRQDGRLAKGALDGLEAALGAAAGRLASRCDGNVHSVNESIAPEYERSHAWLASRGVVDVNRARMRKVARGERVGVVVDES